MSIISGLLAGAKMLFGGGGDGVNNVMTVAKGVGNFIDEQEFTPEEKAKMNAEVVLPAMQKFMESTVGENTERSITRRKIALWVIRNWILMLWVSIIAFGIELILGTPEHVFSAFVLGIAVISELTWLVLGIGAFFFGAHIVRQAKEK